VGGGACSRGRRGRGRCGSILLERVSLPLSARLWYSYLPIKFGMKRKMFSFSGISSDFGVEGALIVPFPLGVLLGGAITLRWYEESG
jgi:hypothetical protein